MNSPFEYLHSTMKIGKNQEKQLIFTSQSYGTNYFVYANFKSHRNKDGDCVITGLEGGLLNYKGLLNLGFSTNPENKTKVTLEKDSSGNPFILVDLSIQAQVSGTADDNFDINTDEPIVIKKGTNLMVQRTLLPLAGTLNGSPIINGVFDDEFYYRDGTDYAQRIVREIQNPGSKFPVHQIDIDWMDQSMHLGPGRYCRNAFFQVELVDLPD